jgi:hypothetical protein
VQSIEYLTGRVDLIVLLIFRYQHQRMEEFATDLLQIVICVHARMRTE